jgi:hypothetical protein
MYRLKVIRRNRPQVIKGTWQLDGRHKGDMVTDRTAGGAAIDDMERFVRAGGCGTGRIAT